jgi:hypothetical protein
MTAPRDPKPTVNFIDVYCSYYQDLFPEVNTPDSFVEGCRKAIHRIECRCNQNKLHPMDSLKNIVTGLLSTAGHFTNLSERSF